MRGLPSCRVPPCQGHILLHVSVSDTTRAPLWEGTPLAGDLSGEEEGANKTPVLSPTYPQPQGLGGPRGPSRSGRIAPIRLRSHAAPRTSVCMLSWPAGPRSMQRGRWQSKRKHGAETKPTRQKPRNKITKRFLDFFQRLQKSLLEGDSRR